MAEAGGDVVVDQADGLHEGVADSRADEGEAAFFEVFAESVGFGRAGGDGVACVAQIYFGLAVDELPEVAVEAAEIFLDLEQGVGVFDGGGDLESVADDARIAQELGELAGVVAGYDFGIEGVEGCAIVFALVEDGFPTEAGLSTFEN